MNRSITSVVEYIKIVYAFTHTNCLTALQSLELCYFYLKMHLFLDNHIQSY